MAETEGTPSAPTPVDAEAPAQSGAASPSERVPVSPVVTVVRPSEATGTEATRAALRKTLQAGVGMAAAPTSSGPGPAEGELFEQARRVAALADTQQDLPRHPAAGSSSNPPTRSPRNPKLARTLRMDLKLPPASDEPPAGEPAVARVVSPRPHMPTQHGMPLPSAPQSEFSSTRPAGSGSPPSYVQEPGSSPQDPRSTRVGHADPNAASAFGTSGTYGAPRTSGPPIQRKRPLRPGERTMILTKRSSGRKDWLFVMLVVGALGVTASMLLAYHNQSGSDSEGAEAAAPEEEEQETPEDTATQAASTAPAQQPQQAQAQPASSGGIRATELRSDPVGAEVVVNGAVVGNTPVRVACSDTDVDYTLRLPGYESKIVRVGSQSPATISVTLRPNTQ